MLFSIAYGFIRARQLEGTYPGDPRLGVWGITSNRVKFGWGRVAEELWPYFQDGDERHDFHAPKPPGVDQAAKRHRIRSYQRVRSSKECRKIVSHNENCLSRFLRKYKHNKQLIIYGTDVPGYLEIKAAFEITRQFVEAPRGIILLPSPDAEVIGTHAGPFIRDLKSHKAFEFQNPWGDQWGDHGTGRMPYEFFDRWIVEAWAIDESDAQIPEGQGIQELTWDLLDLLGDRLHAFEVYDGDADERIAWTFAVHRERHLDVEELFVRPAYRRQGHAQRLAERLVALSRDLGLPLRAWIPFADCEPGNQPALGSIMSKLGLGIHRSGVTWAAYKAVPDAPRRIHFPLIRIPARPALAKSQLATLTPSASLLGTVLSYEDPFGPAVPAEDWEASR